MEKKLCFLKKRITFFLFNVFIACFLILSFLNKAIHPVFVEYGLSKCVDTSTKIMNKIISDQVKENIEEKIVDVDNEDVIILNFNTAILNSIGANVINKAQMYFDMIEKGTIDNELNEILNFDEVDCLNGGITYSVPLSMAIDNILVSNIGLEIPVRYKFISYFKGRIISVIKEYGINNALLEISLLVNSDVVVSVPFLSERQSIEFVVPILMKVIQGKVPEAYLGSKVLGEVLL